MKEIKLSDWGIVVNKSKARYSVIMEKNLPIGTLGYLEPGSNEYKEFNKDKGKIYDHKIKKIITHSEFDRQIKSLDSSLE